MANEHITLTDEQRTVSVPSPASASYRPTPLQPALLVLTGHDAGRSIRLVEGETTVGRGSECNARINESVLSRRHCEFTVGPAGVVRVLDLDSTNGTHINGQRIEPGLRYGIQPGDRVNIGSLVIKLVLRDEAEERLQARLFAAAVRDPLTSAYNRRYLEDRLAQEFAYAVRHNTPVSLLMIDIDHFKQVNDTYGHAAGDEVLSALGQRIARMTRCEDVFARYGGEEFVLLLRGVDLDRALPIAQRLRSSAALARLQTSQGVISVTLSIGVASTSEGQESAAELLEAADKMLYRAKREGRNRVCSRSVSEHNPSQTSQTA